ncbi:phnA protein [Marinobacterium arenosum]|uniref:phnA protein n=1 Tax=Marinobacterium arenosum TaxID=2862496 RepID=UPI001C965907|nr:phnA protein [Marinobacterium arenosum]MBY4678940.1 phnA protein [Marinobacterium arenosum]
MAKGLDKHQARQQELSLFGKDLVRRCGSQCEMCGASGVPLSIYEVAPVPSEPDFDRCAMFCDSCREQIDYPKRRDNNHWRCLNGAIWSQVPIVKALAVAMLDKLAQQEAWAKDLQEQVYLEGDEQQEIDRIAAELK